MAFTGPLLWRGTDMTERSAAQTAPLAGIRVIEIANFLAAPIATALMADMGAEVIKVEPPAGDTTRAMKMKGDRPQTVNHSFHALNRGKRSITVDLTKSGAATLIRRLVARADVLVTNLMTSRLERYGLSYAELREYKSDIVFAQLTGWGSSGLGASRPGFDSTAYWAGSGLMSLMGDADTPAVVSRGGQGDYPAGLNLLTAVLAALRVRDQTGAAQFVEVTLQRSGLWSLASEMQQVLNNPDYHPTRFDRLAANLATRNAYQTGDGRWMMLAMHNAMYWSKFCQALDRPQWATDPRYISPAGAVQNQTELIPEIDQIFRSHDLAYWADRLDSFGCVWSPAATLEEVADDENLQSQGTFHSISDVDEEGHSVHVLTVPFVVQDADILPRRRAPALGEHTREVLVEAGIDDDELKDIAAAGILG